MQTIDSAIATAVATSAPGKARKAALMGVRWVLRSGSFFVGPIDAKTMDCPLVTDRSQAQVYTGCDNHEMKARFFSAIFGAPFTTELI